MTRVEFARICKSNDVRWTIDTNSNTLMIDPPNGHVFAGTGLHFLDTYLEGWKRADAYEHVACDMDMGIERCSTDDCDYCEDNA